MTAPKKCLSCLFRDDQTCIWLDRPFAPMPFNENGDWLWFVKPDDPAIATLRHFPLCGGVHWTQVKYTGK